MNVDPSALQRIDAQTVARYSARFREHGMSARSLGWGESEHQTVRFASACALVDVHGLEVLDFGCGFGDFLSYMQRIGVAPSRYVGIDLVPEFLEVARNRHPLGQFYQSCDEFAATGQPQVDIGICLGVMNFRQSEMANLAYAATILDRLWPLVRRGLIVDYLSAQRTPDYPEEDWVYYYEPGDVTSLASRYSSCWVLKQDYPAIPQREMMLWMRKS